MPNLNLDRKKIDNLFWWFEENLFKNEGDYPRQTNLVLEFADYVDDASDFELAERLDLYKEYKDDEEALEVVRHIRTEILNGIDKWLEA